MKICVTGARGRLGTILGDWFENDGHDVLRFSRNSDARFTCLGELKSHIRGGADVILHLAWSTVPASSEKNPGIEWRDDLPLLSSIAAECSAISAEGGRSPLLVFFSSCSVYGEKKGDGNVPFTERDELHPKGWYAFAKRSAEELLGKFAPSGIRCLILRISNPFGFSQSPVHLQGIIPVALAAARRRSEMVVWGDGNAKKDFLDIRDLYRALDNALSRQLTGTYNICSGQSRSVREVIELVGKFSERPVAVKNVPAVQWDVGSADYSNELFSLEADWSPRLTLEQGIRDFVLSTS